MKKTNKILSVFLALLMVISIIPMTSIEAEAASVIKTQAEAVTWLNNQTNSLYGGGQCTEFVSAYMNWLVTGTATASGSYVVPQWPQGYVTFAQSDAQNWTVIKNEASTVPQPGDIFVSGNTHTGVVIVPDGTKGATIVDQNSREGYGENGTRSQVIYKNWTTYSGGPYTVTYFIRPKFGTPAPDIDWITGLAGNHYLQNKGSGDWLSVSENKDASTQPINTWGTWGKEFRVNLTAVGNGYKMKFSEISSLLVNPYSDTPTVGTKINLYEDVNNSTQWWGFEKVGDAYVIRSMYNTSLCLTDNGVMPATLTTYTGASNQLWYLHPHSYTVSYNANGGSGAPSSQTKYFNENLTLSSTKPTRSGYTFAGWGTSSGDTSVDYNAGGTYRQNANITLYAIWKENIKTHTVTFDANGGTGAPANQTVNHGSSVTIPNTIPIKNGYTFEGWVAEDSCLLLEPGDGWIIDSPTRFIAVWIPNEYTVSYNANGGTGAPSSQTKYHDTTLTLSTIKPTRTGYTFLGWSTSSTATSATYSSGGSFTANAHTTLYAVWEKNEPQVYVEGNYFTLMLGAVSTCDVMVWTNVEKGYAIYYKIADPSIVSCSWGTWNSENKIPLTITAKSKGETTIDIQLKDKATGELIHYETLYISVAIVDSYIKFNIKEPSTTTIRHNDGIILHLNAEGNIPDGAKILWTVDNNNFDGGYSEDGMQCLLISKNNGYTVITVTLYDANDNVIATDSIEMRSKAGFFDKIGGFFRSLFGTTKIYEY